jgi:hypothetical protein
MVRQPDIFGLVVAAPLCRRRYPISIGGSDGGHNRRRSRFRRVDNEGALDIDAHGAGMYDCAVYLGGARVGPRSPANWAFAILLRRFSRDLGFVSLVDVVFGHRGVFVSFFWSLADAAEGYISKNNKIKFHFRQGGADRQTGKASSF